MSEDRDERYETVDFPVDTNIQLIPLTKVATPQVLIRTVEALMKKTNQTESQCFRALVKAFSRRWAKGQHKYMEVGRAADMFLDAVRSQLSSCKDDIFLPKKRKSH